jgi:hypothetical protein
VHADVLEGVVLALEVEDANLAALDLQDLAAAGRDILDPRNRVFLWHWIDLAYRVFGASRRSP